MVIREGTPFLIVFVSVISPLGRSFLLFWGGKFSSYRIGNFARRRKSDEPSFLILGEMR